MSAHPLGPTPTDTERRAGHFFRGHRSDRGTGPWTCSVCGAVNREEVINCGPCGDRIRRIAWPTREA